MFWLIFWQSKDDKFRLRRRTANVSLFCPLRRIASKLVWIKLISWLEWYHKVNKHSLMEILIWWSSLVKSQTTPVCSYYWSEQITMGNHVGLFVRFPEKNILELWFMENGLCVVACSQTCPTLLNTLNQICHLMILWTLQWLHYVYSAETGLVNGEVPESVQYSANINQCVFQNQIKHHFIQSLQTF